MRKEEEMVSNDSRAFGTSPVGLQQHMKGVAWGILVMAISLALVIILYMWIGYIGPTYSTTIMEKQQANLRNQYGLPPQPPVPKSLLEVPPSLRNLTRSNKTTTTAITSRSYRDSND